jgi:predicted esterase
MVLLHGTGGDEHDLLPLGQRLAPGAHLLSPRGQVLEHGMPRFFRRLAEGVFDVDDLIARAGELSTFIGEAALEYGFDPARVIAAGFSNGANIAAAILLLHPKTFAGAILLHPMVPFEPKGMPSLDGTPVFIGAGRSDPIVAAHQTQRLAALLSSAGASVDVSWHPGGHQLSMEELDAAATWFITHVADDDGPLASQP